MTHIRVMTFNILNLVPDEEAEHFSDIWRNRAPFNVKTIRRYEPDLIGFQEYEPEHRLTYDEMLPEYDYYPRNATGEGTAVYWKRDRFEVESAGQILLPRSALPNPQETEDDPIMVTTWVKGRLRETGDIFIHLNTHLNDESEGARRIGTEANLQQLAELDPKRSIPVIMTGDFNCNPWSPVYRRLLADGFVDTYRAAGHGDSAESSTFHGFRGGDYFSLEWGDQLFWRVDWVMLRAGTMPLQTSACAIARDAELRDGEPALYASDHYPVVAEIMLLE